ncbi:MAG: NrfD/PsrC family molybdoenzyme membrane anchor subunit [Gordonibacter sp.]|uniref:NrfD/PsrC family molybdoenzyme membrane anchor subunit n=1 Tax=Gordonibacter sp. TaxID=1968902 RepID=UPI002FCC0D18
MTNEASKQSRVPLIVAAVLTCVGLGAWIMQVTQGMQITALTDTYIWGFSVAIFYAMMACAAGLMALCGFAEFKGSVMDRGERKLAMMFAAPAMAAAGILIIMDLGNPCAFFSLITSLNLTSFTVLDFWAVLFCVIVGIVYLVMLAKGSSNKLIGTIAMITALTVIVIEGIMMANNTSHALWASGMSVASFLVAAFTGGTALLAAIAPRHKNLFIAGLLAVSAIVLAEVVTGLISGTDLSRGMMMAIVTGPFAPYFWIQIVVGIVVPLFLIVKTNHVIPAAICTFVGLACHKLWFVLAGEAETGLAYHHIGSVAESFDTMLYVPSLIEVCITVGALALAVLAFIVIRDFIFKGDVR